MTTVEHARRRFRSSRATVGRDTITILGGALLAVIAGNLAGFGGPVRDLASPTPDDSSMIIGGGSLVPHPTFPPIETLGDIVNPTVGFEATPTPIPIITLGPSESPSPSPSPTATATTKPTAKPTPIATPNPTLPPKPSATFTCTSASLLLSCSVNSTANATSWSWDWGDSADPTPGSGSTAEHLYPTDGCYLVTLVAIGPGGNSTSSQTLPVSAAPPGPSC